jgi:tetratricopeptide (TPR) repeat protein
VLLALALSQPSGAAQSAEPTAAELFTVYRQGQFEKFTGQLARVGDFGDLRKQIARDGRDWPIEAKAAFLLETADLALQQKPLTNRTGPGVDLFEDACKAVRQLAPQGQFEAAWHAVAFSVLSARYATGLSVDDHLKHIRGRFDEGRMALVRAMPGERNAWYEATQVQPTLPKTGPEPMEGFLPSRRRMGHAHMRDVVKLFESARRFESVRAEATLRQAALLATWDFHDEALPLLASVDGMTDDPWLRYMSALMSGRSLEATGRSREAHGAYQAALNLQANGRAARLALASMVFATGLRDEADRLVGEALSERAGPPDPWKEFLAGDFRFLDIRRDAMRGRLR